MDLFLLMNFLKEENSMSKRYYLFSVLIAVSMILAACGGGAKAPDVCAENPDESVCAVIEEGSTIKIGYAGPMAGDYSAFGIDISQAGLLAVEDAGEFEGFSFELLVEDTQGSGEGGASVANLYVSDPDVVAIAGHNILRFCSCCNSYLQCSSFADAFPVCNPRRT